MPKTESQLRYPVPHNRLVVWTLNAIKKRRRERIVAALYSTYGDESLDKSGKRVFAVAGVFGRQQEWDNLTIDWFKKTHGIDFHATDCESDEGDFTHNSHRQNLKIYRDVTTLLCRTRLSGHAIAISLEAYKKHFPKAHEGSAYLLCFAHVVMYCAEMGYLSIPQGKVKFIFHRYPKQHYNATQLYDYLSKFPGWQNHPYLDTELAFSSSEQKAEIQAADLVAHEAMKRWDGYVGCGKPDTRLSMQALLNTNRFSFRYLGDKEFSDLVRRADNLGKRIKGSKESEYQAWLQRHRYQDNNEMRLNYLIRLDDINKI